MTGGPAEGQVIDHPPRLQTVLTVGRTKASRVHIKDPAVSEKHGEIRWTGAGWELRDLGSSNGTKVNGRALSAGDMRISILPPSLPTAMLVQSGHGTMQQRRRKLDIRSC